MEGQTVYAFIQQKAVQHITPKAGMQASEEELVFQVHRFPLICPVGPVSTVLSIPFFSSKTEDASTYFIVYLGNPMRQKYFIKVFIINYELLNKYKMNP